MLTTPRLLYAMADQGHLPGSLCRVHPRWRTPHIAIAAQGTLALGLAMAGSFEELAKLSAIARIVSYASTCLALLVFRNRASNTVSFTVPGGPVIPVAAVLLCAGLVATSSARHLMLGASALAAGSVLYFLRTRTAGRSLS